MLAFGAGVLAQALYKAFNPSVPDVATMGVVGTVARGANLDIAFLLLDPGIGATTST